MGDVCTVKAAFYKPKRWSTCKVTKPMDVEWQGKEKTRGRGGNPIHGLGKVLAPHL
ncbi:MAG: hypothetical protein H6Q06_1246 [Acidobacteria bacterium]|nr:hypothetical protein [Acidobacteriota bacterium]